jgi:2,3-bisphosphoglycerate-independent phosphoglycerate mutase
VKYVVLIMDGASGLPVETLGGRTSLEAAATPNLDKLAKEGTVGLAHTVPEGFEPSSAVACMSVLGFDPVVFYAGRGPIEAMAMGIDLEPGQVAMRCNFVTILDGVMVSYSAGNITAPEAAELLAAIQAELGDERLHFHPGVGFRSVLTVRDGADLLETTFAAPHDITDRPVVGSGPVGAGAGLTSRLMEKSKDILAGHPVNKARVARGLPPATQIWLFWPGVRPGQMPTFFEAYGKRSALTSAVDLLRGLALQARVDFLDVPGVTDEADNDYRGQMAAALAALDRYDVVFVHVEAPDEEAHAGSVAGKVKAIEQIDALMVEQVVNGTGLKDGVSILVMPDHPTPLVLKTHVGEPVPFVLWGPGFAANGAKRFTEAEARATGFAVAPGHLLMGRLLAEGCRGSA